VLPLPKAGRRCESSSLLDSAQQLVTVKEDGGGRKGGRNRKEERICPCLLSSQSMHYKANLLQEIFVRRG